MKLQQHLLREGNLRGRIWGDAVHLGVNPLTVHPVRDGEKEKPVHLREDRGAVLRFPKA